MGRTVVVEVDLYADDRSLDGFPFVAAIDAETKHAFAYQHEPDAEHAPAFVAAPSSRVGVCRALVLTADQDFNFKLNGQSDGALPLKAGGVIVVLNGIFDGGAFVHATLQRPTGAAATIRGLAAGDHGIEIGFGEDGFGDGGFGGQFTPEGGVDPESYEEG